MSKTVEAAEKRLGKELIPPMLEAEAAAANADYRLARFQSPVPRPASMLGASCASQERQSCYTAPAIQWRRTIREWRCTEVAGCWRRCSVARRLGWTACWSRSRCRCRPGRSGHRRGRAAGRGGRGVEERVRAAIRSIGRAVPGRPGHVNLAPADLRKEGPAYDLPIALGILMTNRQVIARHWMTPS